MVHAVTQARSKVRIRYVSLARFDRLFEIKEQFGEGSFCSVSGAISVVERKMVMIKKLRGRLRIPLIEITEFKMLQAMRGWPFVPKFTAAFQVNRVRVAFVFEHKYMVNLNEVWL